jgi:hypothetical protein
VLRLSPLMQILLLGPLVACGGSSPAPQSPTPIPTPTPPPPWTVSGRVVTTRSGGSVARAHVDAFIASADTDAGGAFTLTAPTGPAGRRFYLKTQDEFGRPLSNNDLETVRRGIREGVQYFTAGTYQADIVEGTETRPAQVGWVNVVPRQEIPEGDYCGLASSVGVNPMTVQLRIDRCGCGSIKIGVGTVIHEIGHARGAHLLAPARQPVARSRSRYLQPDAGGWGPGRPPARP